MGSSIVTRSEFLDVECSILVEVESFESALNKISSELGHLADNYAQELIEVDFSTLVNIH
jgi:hypothetical protein